MEVSRRRLVAGGLVLAGGGMLAAPGQSWAHVPPPIVDCAGWGARPNRAVVPVHNRRPVKILVHHTATPNVADLGRGAADALARGIQNVHMDHRGWLDSGQHFTISRGGVVLEGRHRSLELLNIGKRQVEGAHCTGQNIVSVGIENQGTYSEADPTPELWNRLREMCAYLCRQYRIAPTEIFGHRDFRNTLCPGDRLHGTLPRLRGEVATTLGRRLEGGAARKAHWPLLRAGDRGTQVTAAQFLLRDAGTTVAEPDGDLGPETDAAVRRFQLAHGAEDVNGLLGGDSWPVLARTVYRGEGGDAERALRALAVGGAESMPSVVTPPVWQRLLGTGGAPTVPTQDPPPP